MMIFVALCLISATLIVLAVLSFPPNITILLWIGVAYTAQEWWMK
jgi:hypothetical protein